MPVVQQSGIYRNDEGHAYWLRRGYVVSPEVAANYTLDLAATLSDVQAAIVTDERGGAPLADPVAFKTFGTPGAGPNPVTPESIHTAPGSNDPVTAKEVATTGEAAEPEPVDVAPGGRRRNKRPKGMQTPEDGEKTPETPEDGDEEPETLEGGNEGGDN